MKRPDSDRIVMLLQPSYLPWLGFFEQALRSDFFVVFDDTQYTKGDWRNRNRIQTNDGRIVYLTVPVERAPTQTWIRDIRIAQDIPWQERHRNLLMEHYRKAPYFAAYFPAIESILRKPFRFLIDLNLELIRYFFSVLNADCEILLNSSLELSETGKSRLLGVSRHLKASVCYNGSAGKSLYDPADFSRHGIRLAFQDFQCPEYPRGALPFVPNLSIVDILFFCGPESRNFIIAGGGARTASTGMPGELRCG